MHNTAPAACKDVLLVHARIADVGQQAGAPSYSEPTGGEAICYGEEPYREDTDMQKLRSG